MWLKHISIHQNLQWLLSSSHPQTFWCLSEPVYTYLLSKRHLEQICCKWEVCQRSLLENPTSHRTRMQTHSKFKTFLHPDSSLHVEAEYQLNSWKGFADFTSFYGFYFFSEVSKTNANVPAEKSSDLQVLLMVAFHIMQVMRECEPMTGSELKIKRLKQNRIGWILAFNYWLLCDCFWLLFARSCVWLAGVCCV